MQVKFVFEIFKTLRPGIPLKFIHGRMQHVRQQAVVAGFNESTSVLFSTDLTSRGLDIQNVDWVVQVCYCLALLFLLYLSCSNLFVTFAG